MNNIKVTVCNCTNCMMNGAADIAEAIESLKKLKVQYRVKANVHIENANIGTHGNEAPVVMVNNKVLTNARAETVMSQVLHILNGNGGE